MNKIHLSSKIIGLGHRPYIIAEVAQAHDGSLGLAHAYIDASAKAGADAIKFQTHYAAEESTPGEPWRVKFSYQDASRYDYWKRMEFTDSQWKGLKKHADDVGIDFISTPFSLKAVELLDDLQVPFWKISSGDINNLPLLEEVALTGKPVVLSSGMSSMSELDRAIELLDNGNIEYAVLQCTTAYPCPPNKIGLNNIALFRERYNCPVGLSDHSGKIYAGLAAATYGADIIEVHVVFDKDMFGPDVSSSLTFDELRTLTEGCAFIHETLNNPVDKDHIVMTEMQELRSLFNKSIVLNKSKKSGELITRSDLAFKKPGKGLSPDMIDSVIGKKAVRDLEMDTFISVEDIC